MPSEPVVAVLDLRKRYGDRDVLRGVELTVPEGVVFGLIGPNGAGKTTTLEILEGYRRRTSGHVSVLGTDPAGGGRDFRERIGILLQEGGIEPYLTVAEVLDATRAYFPRPLPRADLLEAVGLVEQADIRVRRLSAGQRRRLGLCLALCGDPDLLFLDEPTVGFDPEARRAAWAAIRRFATSGRTVILATNVMEEAQALADVVAVIVRGRVLAAGSPVEVVGASGPGSTVRFRLPSGGPTLPAELTRTMATMRGESVELRTTDPASLIHKLGAWAVRSDVTLADLVVAPRSLEDAYLDLIATAAAADAPAERDEKPAAAASGSFDDPAAVDRVAG